MERYEIIIKKPWELRNQQYQGFKAINTLKLMGDYQQNSEYISENSTIYISLLVTKPVIPQACPSLALLCLPSCVLYHDGHRFGYSYKL
jgi:hypothetical protein